MALILGTNCGFVTVAPSADPEGTNNVFDNYSISLKDTTTSANIRVTEIGYYVDGISEAADVDVGIYSDNSAGEPHLLLFSDLNNAKGTTAGWKTVAVNWELNANTDYWIAIGCTDTATDTFANVGSSGGDGSAYKNSTPSIPADWGSSTGTDGDGTKGIYALYELIAPDSTDNMTIIGENIY